jgi:hypothetical protein
MLVGEYDNGNLEIMYRDGSTRRVARLKTIEKNRQNILFFNESLCETIAHLSRIADKYNTVLKAFRTMGEDCGYGR